MDVSVVITCWNGENLLRKNLPKVIEASKNPRNQIIEIIVVDDGSEDNSVDFLKKNFPGVKTVVHEENKGYSVTGNTGVKEARGELVAILNLDVIPEKDFLVAAFPHFQDEKVFAVSFNEGKFGPGKIEWKKGFLEIIPTSISEKSEITSWASGGSSVFRKKIWEKLGGMDEAYLPFYFEDIDLGLRAKKKGFLCLWEPNSRVEHKHESTINSENFDMKYVNSIKERNHLILTWKSINNPSRFFSHFFYLGKRLILAPGYLKIVFMAVRQRVKY